MRAVIDLFALALARPLIGLIGLLPRAFGLAFCLGIVRVLRVLMPRLDGVALRNLELVFPQVDLGARQRVMQRAYVMLAENFLDYCRLPQRKGESSRFDIQPALNWFNDHYAREPQTGVICFTFHFGSSEGLIQEFALHGLPMSILARGFGLPRFDAWWNGRRELYGHRLFARRGGFQETLRTLNAGGRIAVLVDQNVKANYATFVEFFGHQVAATKPMALAMLRTGARGVFGVPVAVGEGRWELWFRELPPVSEFVGTEDERAQQIMQLIHHFGEQVIREHPDHWFWIHRRFKTRPAGEPENFYR